MADTRQFGDIGRFAKSSAYREQAAQHLAFGVSSTPRANQKPAVIAIDHAEGIVLTDIDGNSYLDYALGYGPLILGHTPEIVTNAIRDELARGLRTASVHMNEAALADLMAQTVPSAAKTAFVSSGTEAVQLALRIARAGTGRTRIVKFRANYHGWFDSVQIGSVPGSDGPDTIGQDPSASTTVKLMDWGDSDALEKQLDSSFAAVLVEPAAINAGCFLPPPGFLECLRAITRRHGVMLIFDEVITGFRLALGGAQQVFGITPDLTILGKALAAGLPIGAVSGTNAAMEPIATGRLMHRGTFNGNPLSMAAGIACLRELGANRARIYADLARHAADISAHINAEAARASLKLCAQHTCGAVQIFAGLTRIQGMADLNIVDKDMVLRFTGMLLQHGVFTLPRGLMYVSAIHSDADIALTKTRISVAMKALAGQTG